MNVLLGCANCAVTQKGLNRSDIHAVYEPLRSPKVTQVMEALDPGQTSTAFAFPEGTARVTPGVAGCSSDEQVWAVQVRHEGGQLLDGEL